MSNEKINDKGIRINGNDIILADSFKFEVDKLPIFPVKNSEQEVIGKVVNIDIENKTYEIEFTKDTNIDGLDVKKETN
jgi:predicted RNA-binding protein